TLMALAGAEKSKGKFFFITSQILMLLALYSLYDEAVVRRPWKQFQREFQTLQLQVAQKKYDEAYKKYVDDGSDKKIAAVNLELEKAMTAKESDEYKKLTKEVHELQNSYDDDALEIKFNKSILDAYYYDWKHSFQSGHDYEAAKKKYEDLDAKITDE